MTDTAALVRSNPSTARPITPEPPPNDQRTRHALKDVEANLGGLEKARVLNMSLSGAGIQTGQYLHIGRSYSFRFMGASEMMCLDATVVWCRLVRTLALSPSESRPVFLAGLKFDDLTSRDEAKLAELLATSPAILRSPSSSRSRRRRRS